MKISASYITIFFITLMSVVQGMAQSSQPDLVCMGTTKKYYVDATLGSSYIWKINGGIPEASTTNSVDIKWTTSGIYTLTAQEKSKNNCLGLVQSLQVTVVEPPKLQLTSEIGTESQTVCLGSPIREITYSFGGGATGVTVTGLADGVNYVVNGTNVTLSGIPTASDSYTITTVGGAPWAVLSLNGSITAKHLSTATITGTTITCQHAASPVVTFKGVGGIAPYTFTYNINGGSNKTVNTTTGDTVTVSVPTKVPGIFAYNLVDVTDSKYCSNAQTGIATITISNPAFSTTNCVICPSQLPLKWNGIECTGAGTYLSADLRNAAGCDSIASLELIVQSPLTSTTETTLCSSELPYEWNGYKFTTSGIQQAYLRTVAGCDSIATLKLNVNNPTSAIESASFCEGESYLFNGKIYTEPGFYDVPLQCANGCDSIVTLVLKEERGLHTTQVIRLFPGETYSINGNTYSEAGVYTEVMKVADKCADVLVTELSFIDIPNTLTPNGDGKNDLFMVGHHIQIFNRNGILLYDGMDGWAGKHKNKPVSKDTYFYVLYYNSGTQIKYKEGYIMVLP